MFSFCVFLFCFHLFSFLRVFLPLKTEPGITQSMQPGTPTKATKSTTIVPKTIKNGACWPRGVPENRHKYEEQKKNANAQNICSNVGRISQKTEGPTALRLPCYYEKVVIKMFSTSSTQKNIKRMKMCQS